MESDLLPALPEAYSIGSNDKPWLRSVLQGRDYLSNLGRLTSGVIGSYISPDEALPFIEFYAEIPIGSPTNRFVILNYGGNLEFWAITPEGGYNKPLAINPAGLVLGYHLFPDHPNVDLGVISAKWRDLYVWRDAYLDRYIFFGNITSYPTPSETYRLAGIGNKAGSNEADSYKICRKTKDGTYRFKNLLKNNVVLFGTWRINNGVLESDSDNPLTVDGDLWFNTDTTEMEVD